MRQYKPLESIPRARHGLEITPQGDLQALSRNLEVIYALLQEVNDRISDVQGRLDNHNIRGKETQNV